MQDRTKFIKERIEKTGFPFEIEIASALKKAEWEVLLSSPYWDEDEEKWREIDIKAYKTITQIDGKDLKPYSLTLALIIECKKTEGSAWVFFPWPRDTSDMQLLRINYLDFLTVAKRQSLLIERIQYGESPSPAELRLLNLDPDILTSHQALIDPKIAKNLKFFSELGIIAPDTFKFFTAREKALNYKEIKLNKEHGSGPHEIFEAINILIKATKQDMKLSSLVTYAGTELAKRGADRGTFQIKIFIPILLFRGELYKWSNDEVNEVDQVLLEGKCHTNKYFENMLIGVVKDSHFDKFLSELNDDQGELLRRICSKRGDLEEQVKIIMKSPDFYGPPRPSLI